MIRSVVQSRNHAHQSLLQGSFYVLRRFPNSDCRRSRHTRSSRYINTVPLSCYLSSLTLSLSLHGRWPNVGVSTESKSSQSLFDFQDVLRGTRIYPHLPHHNHEGLRLRRYHLLFDPKCWIGFPLPEGSYRTPQPAQDRACCPNYRFRFPDGRLLHFHPLYNPLPSQEHSTQGRFFASPSTLVLGILPHGKPHHNSFHLPDRR